MYVCMYACIQIEEDRLCAYCNNIYRFLELITNELVVWMNGINASNSNDESIPSDANFVGNSLDNSRYDSIDVMSTLFQSNVLEDFRHELYDIALTRLIAVIAMDFTSNMRSKLFKGDEWYAAFYT